MLNQKNYSGAASSGSVNGKYSVTDTVTTTYEAAGTTVARNTSGTLTDVSSFYNSITAGYTFTKDLTDSFSLGADARVAVDFNPQKYVETTVNATDTAYTAAEATGSYTSRQTVTAPVTTTEKMEAHVYPAVQFAAKYAVVPNKCVLTGGVKLSDTWLYSKMTKTTNTAATTTTTVTTKSDGTTQTDSSATTTAAAAESSSVNQSLSALGLSFALGVTFNVTDTAAFDFQINTTSYSYNLLYQLGIAYTMAF